MSETDNNSPSLFRSSVALGLELGGIQMGYRTKKSAYKANAANILAEAEQDLTTSIAEERIQRVNQGRAISMAQTAQASSGFDGSGTADAGERSVSQQFEQAIDNAAHARSVAYGKAKYAAAMEQWKARVARKARNFAMITSTVEAALPFVGGQSK